MADFQLATTAPLLLFGGGGIGPKGDRGSEIFIQPRSPLNADGLPLDVWINPSTGQTWKKQLNNTWLEGARFPIGGGVPISAIIDGFARTIIDGRGRTISYA